jgi:3-phosphoshikimate 1-carboxyvinyltransferase
VDYELPVASAQVKSAILLAGLFAEGVTRIHEPTPTRDHTERLLRAMGVEVAIEKGAVTLYGAGASGPRLTGREWRVPGDFSSAAFWWAAAAARPGAEVTVRDVGLNPRRTAFLDVLRRMGAEVEVKPDAAGEAWEPIGRVTVRGRGLRGVEIGGAEIPNLIDEIPVLTAIAALAEGETRVRDARELRVKESDRIAVMAGNLRRLGVEVEEQEDGLIVRGPAQLKAADDIHSQEDHRVAMAMAILALHGTGPVVIHRVECVATSYPGFWDDLKCLTQ